MKLLFLSFLLLVFSTQAQQKGGILGKKAPKWEVTKWHNLSKETKTLDIDDYKGKVIYLYCFQSWCPGCHSKGFPTLKKVQEKFKDNDNVKFVAIQTVFEGYHANTFANALKVSKKFGLKLPFGQSGEKGVKSSVMKAYKTRGTPWTIIIGKDGLVKYNDFHIKVDDAKKIIDKELNTK
jgi:thiol-disulfide isomerase/thioredoxin